MSLRLGSIELKSFSHGVTIPVDPSWGKLTGTRVHSPITIVKDVVPNDEVSDLRAAHGCWRWPTHNKRLNPAKESASLLALLTLNRVDNRHAGPFK